MRKLLFILFPVLCFAGPALAGQRPHRYHIVGEDVFTDVGSLDNRPYFGVWVQNKNFKSKLYRVKAIRIDRIGIYFLKGDILPLRQKKHGKDWRRYPFPTPGAT